MVALLQQRFQPNKVLLFRSEDDAGKKLSELCPFVAEMRPVDRKTTVYICEGYTCRSPLTDAAALQAALG